jgi:hypothetical protein
MSTLYGGVYSPGRFFHVEISVKKFKWLWENLNMNFDSQGFIIKSELLIADLMVKKQRPAVMWSPLHSRYRIEEEIDRKAGIVNL